MLHCYYGGKELTLFQYSKNKLANSLCSRNRNAILYATGVASKNILYSPRRTMRVVSEGTTLAYRANNQTLYVPTSGIDILLGITNVDVSYIYKSDEYADDYALIMKNLYIDYEGAGTIRLDSVNGTAINALISGGSFGLTSFVSTIASSEYDDLTNKTYSIPFIFTIANKYKAEIDLNLTIPKMSEDSSNNFVFR